MGRVKGGILLNHKRIEMKARWIVPLLVHFILALHLGTSSLRIVFLQS